MNDRLSRLRGNVPPAACPARRGVPRALSDRSKKLFERCLHVVALASLTVAQPLLDLLAHHAEFFVAHRFSRADVGFLLVFLLVLIPLPAVVLEILLIRTSDRAGRIVHGLIVAFLAGLFWLLILKRHGQLPAGLTLSIAAGAGVLLAVAYLNARWLRFFVSALAIAIVAIPAAFLTSPQMRKIVSTRQASLHELPSVTSSAPIVFIIFDEFPASILLGEDGEINRHRYPNFADLAQTSSWFANAVSVAETSETAIPAILTGTYPEPGRLPALEDHPRNLFTLFGGAYKIWAREPMSALCPPELNLLKSEDSRLGRLRAAVSDLAIVYQHLIFPRPWDARLPPIDAAWRDFVVSRDVGAPGDQPSGTQAAPSRPKKKSFFAMAVEANRRDRREEFASLAAALKRGSRSLYFLHVLLPHRPWEFTPQGHRYPDGSSIPGLRKDQWVGGEHLVQQAYQRLIAQVQMVDAEVGRLTRRLQELDLFDRSLIVMAGDHGASFRPDDGRRLVSNANAHDIMPVPLLIKLPGQRQARRVEHPVGTVDVMPTVLEALGIEPPWELEGRAGFDPRPRQLRFVTKQRGSLDVHPAVHREKYETSRWKLRLFGDGSDPLDLYRLGPDGYLVGRPTSELVDHGPRPFIASIKDLERFENVALADGIPVFVTGAIGAPETEPCCRLAVALNGTVYGTTRTYVNTGRRRRFSILLPSQGFRAGPNRIDVYQLLEGDGAVRPIRLRPAQNLPKAPS